MDAVEVRKDDQPELFAFGTDFTHLGRVATIWCQWLLGFAVFDQFHCPKTADPAYITDGGAPRFGAFELWTDYVVTEWCRIFDPALIGHGVDGPHGSSGCQRMPGIGEPTRIGAVAERIVDGFIDDDAT